MSRRVGAARAVIGASMLAGIVASWLALCPAARGAWAAEPGRADGDASSILAEARKRYTRREDRGELAAAIALAQEASERVLRSGGGAAAEVFAELARYFYCLAEFHLAEGGEQSAAFLRGVEYAEKAIEWDPRAAAGYFWKGANLGGWGKANGLGFFSRRREFTTALEEALRLDESYEYWGAHRALAGYYAPRFGVWGDSERADFHSGKAHANAPEHLWNRLIRAEFLEKAGRRGEAREIILGIQNFDLGLSPPDLLFDNSKVRERVRERYGLGGAP